MKRLGLDYASLSKLHLRLITWYTNNHLFASMTMYKTMHTSLSF